MYWSQTVQSDLLAPLNACLHLYYHYGIRQNHLHYVVHLCLAWTVVQYDRCFFYNGYVHVAEIKWKQKTVGAMHGMKEQYTLLGAAGIRPRGQI